MPGRAARPTSPVRRFEVSRSHRRIVTGGTDDHALAAVATGDEGAHGAVLVRVFDARTGEATR